MACQLGQLHQQADPLLMAEILILNIVLTVVEAFLSQGFNYTGTGRGPREHIFFASFVLSIFGCNYISL